MSELLMLTDGIEEEEEEEEEELEVLGVESEEGVEAVSVVVVVVLVDIGRVCLHKYCAIPSLQVTSSFNLTRKHKTNQNKKLSKFDQTILYEDKVQQYYITKINNII